MLILLLVLLLLYGLLHLPSVQTYLVKKVSENLSSKLKTEVSVKSVDVHFFNKLLIGGVMVRDLKKDTLLYAGTIKGTVADWFFLKDKISIENVALDNVVVKINRKDSVWNFQFLIDYFSTSKKKDTTKPIQLDLQQLHFSNIRFSQTDQWLGQNMNVSFKNLDVETNRVNIAQKQIDIKSIYINEPIFEQTDYLELRPEKAVENNSTQNKIASKYKWNNDGWVMQLANLTIKNGAFILDKQSDEKPYTDRFDGQHIFFSNLQGSFKNCTFVNDTLQANIILSANEKSGLQIKKLASVFKLTPDVMEFAKLDLETNNSKLGDYYAMKYQDFGEDFGHFLHKVNIAANLKQSTLSTDDLAIFAPNLKSWKRVIKLDGIANGTLDNFTAKEMKLQTGVTTVEGNISMHGLPQIKSTFIDFESKNLSTTYNEIASIIPEIKSITNPSLNKLGNINFKGSFTGFISDFVSYGKCKTNLGDIVADVNMKTPEGKPPKYSGKIESDGFAIGKFLDINDLNQVALNVKIDGTGFGLKDLKEKVTGNVNYIDVAGYRYNNIAIDGNFEKKLFQGHASIADENIKISTLDGSINFVEKNPGFNFVANVEKADFKKLGFVKNNLLFSGKIDADFTGNSIDNFLGSAKITDASLLESNSKLSFDYLTLNSELIEGKKSLALSSNEFDANINGNFKIMELPKAVRVLLARYYPSYVTAPSGIIKSTQAFDFTINTKNVDNYIKIFDKKLGGFNNAAFSGNFNLKNYELNLNGTIPQISYDRKLFNNVTLNSIGTKDTLLSTLTVSDIIVNDSFHLPNTVLKIAANNDLSIIKLNTSASKILGNAELNASLQTMSDGVKINFYPSSFIINDKKWQLEKNGELILRDKFINANEVKFFHADQALVLKTVLDTDNNDTHLVAELKNIAIEDFAFVLPKKPELKGKVNGIATLEDIFGKRNLSFIGASDSTFFDKKYIGKINIENASYKMQDGIINYKVSINEKDFALAFDGGYNLKDSTGNALHNSFEINKADLSILQPYLSSVFSDLQGYASGKITLNQQQNMLQLVGNAIIDSGSITVSYTQVKYRLNHQKINFGEGSIDLNNLQIQDTLGNKGSVNGMIYHKGFSDFSFSDLSFSSPKMVLLNTTKKDNAQFYGSVIGRANMSINGGVNNMLMEIEGEPSISDSSHVYLPTDNNRESNTVDDYISFLPFGRLIDDVSQKNETNLNIRLKLTANENCKIDVILDETTKDVIKGQGKGILNIEVGTKKALTIDGQYELTKGDYTYNFQNFVRKPFILNSGGTITWNGDPFAANLDLTAVYQANGVDLSPLKSTGNTTTSGSRQQEDVIIKSKITGLLKTPSIRFEFDLPAASEFNKDDIIKKKLADFRNDDNETIKQVASLLLLNQFISSEQGLAAGGTYSFAANTIGGFVSSWLSSLVNGALEKVTNGKLSFDIDVNPSLNTQLSNQLQATVKSSIKYRISKNLILYLGGNIDYNNPLTQIYSKGLITPDLSLEWLINKDGSLRVIAFNRTSIIDATTGQRNRTGLQLGYRKEVDRIGDIFRSKKQIEKLDSLEQIKPLVKRKQNQ